MRKTLPHMIPVFFVAVVMVEVAADLSAAPFELAPPEEKTSTSTAQAIQDNSFLIEEAYNQEAGVVQHIMNGIWTVDSDGGSKEHDFGLVFTQEWPVGSQTHQLSYTIPYEVHDQSGDSNSGFGDILLNYRLQLTTETDTRPAIAPRFSLIVPTGNDDNDAEFGNGAVGGQFNLPVSKIIADQWTVHANAGFTFFPDAHDQDLLSYNLGGSVIYAINRDLNLMLECVALWDEQLTAGGGTDHTVSVVLSPGVRGAINLAGDMQIVWGVAVPIGLTSDAPDYGVFLYLSIEHPFGD